MYININISDELLLKMNNHDLNLFLRCVFHNLTFDDYRDFMFINNHA